MTLDVQALGRALTNVIPPQGERIGGWYAADVAREYEKEAAALATPVSENRLPPDRADPPHYDGAPHCAGTSEFGPDHARLCIRYSEHDSRALATPDRANLRAAAERVVDADLRAQSDDPDVAEDGEYDMSDALDALHAALATADRAAGLDVERLARVLQVWWTINGHMPGSDDWEIIGGWLGEAKRIAAAYDDASLATPDRADPDGEKG